MDVRGAGEDVWGGERRAATQQASRVVGKKNRVGRKARITFGPEDAVRRVFTKRKAVGGHADGEKAQTNSSGLRTERQQP